MRVRWGEGGDPGQGEIQVRGRSRSGGDPGQGEDPDQGGDPDQGEIQVRGRQQGDAGICDDGRNWRGGGGSWGGEGGRIIY